MAFDRKTGLIELDLGGQVCLQVNFKKIADLERKTGKGIIEYTTELYTAFLSFSHAAVLFHTFAIEPELTQEQWGEYLFKNRGDLNWGEFVLDFASVVFDRDMRTPAKPEEGENAKNASPGIGIH